MKCSKQVTVVGRKEIEQAPVKSVQDLLNYVAGVDLQQRSPHSVQADVSLRGGSADQVAILLNGVNLTNPQTGHYSLDIPINLSDIERIEIVQGPTSLGSSSRDSARFRSSSRRPCSESPPVRRSRFCRARS